jgi:hypothetical protein
MIMRYTLHPPKVDLPFRVIIQPCWETLQLQRLTTSDGSATPNVPFIDFDALMDRVVDAVSSTVEAQNELTHLPDTFMRDGLLGQGIGLDGDDEGFDLFLPERITSCASKLGYRLLDEFKQLKLYKDGELPYLYEGMTNDRSILLRLRSRHHG